MPKNYVILYDANYVTFPVKAQRSPYTNKPWFCGGYPQFFGGKSNPREGPLKVLMREVAEESCGGLQLHPSFSMQILEITDSRTQEVYAFHCSKNWSQTGIWPNHDKWKEGPRDSREMCWVAQAPKAAFTGLVSPTPEDVAAYLVAAAPKGNELFGNPQSWVTDQIAKGVSLEFRDSHTVMAFDIFRNMWKRGDLP